MQRKELTKTILMIYNSKKIFGLHGLCKICQRCEGYWLRELALCTPDPSNAQKLSRFLFKPLTADAAYIRVFLFY